ncbi:MAG: hypothetical protein LBP59_19240 [Planctomycetaceae bacterium]|nr:hypothetical protein [Planctomycetaceae bacterium]
MSNGNFCVSKNSFFGELNSHSMFISTANERVYIRLVFQQLAFVAGSRASRLQAVVLNR